MIEDNKKQLQDAKTSQKLDQQKADAAASQLEKLRNQSNEAQDKRIAADEKAKRAERLVSEAREKEL